MTPPDLPGEFRYELLHTLRFSEREWRYRVEGRDGCIEFWVSSCRVPAETTLPGLGREFYGGVEEHRAIPKEGDGPPGHGRCSALSDRACWHDGSSLYAIEKLIPEWAPNRDDHEAMFRRLVGIYRERFEKKEP